MSDNERIFRRAAITSQTGIGVEERATIMAWRREERQRLIDARMKMSVAERQRASARIMEGLDRYCLTEDLLPAGTVVSGYWPLRGEPDLRAWLATLHAQGMTCVLPVVVTKGEPLQFRRWFPGCAMERGFWNIQVPADPAPHDPQLLLAPVVGFDAQGYRLGYGGGYFDRTLAQMQARQLPYRTIGVGYAAAVLDSIRPLPHDIRLHAIVTEQPGGD
jgi:5-formyltetrahydrofolate cyclo-ligase